jgi:hypothetical protein
MCGPQEVRLPLLRLRDELSRQLSDCKAELRALAKEVDGQEVRLRRHKQAVEGLRRARDDLRARLVHHRRVVSGLLREGEAPHRPFAAEGDRLSPPMHSLLFAPEAIETQAAPDLERRLLEINVGE